MRDAGFSLITMSIILTVAALVFVSFLPGREAGDINQKIITNEHKLEKVEEAMRSFMAFNGRRPCPAGSYPESSLMFGMEAASPTGSCQGGTPAAPLGPDVGTSNIVGGTIPTKTLGLPNSYAFDSWGRPFTYIVDKRATSHSSCLTLEGITSTNSTPIGTGGLNIVNTANAGGVTLDKTMYAYISHGPSGYGAFPAQGSTVAGRINSGSTDGDMQHNAGVDAHFPGTSAFTYSTANFTNSVVQKDAVASNLKTGGSDTGFYDFVWYRPDLRNTCCLGAQCTLSGGGGSGNIWVLDTWNWRVQKFDSNGNYISQFGSHGSGNGQFGNAYGIVVDASGNIWVVDYVDRVQEFDNSGNYLKQFGSNGSGNGQFSMPTGITIDASGNIWVVDSGNDRVEKFDSNGNYLSKLFTGGGGNGYVCEPYRMAFDSSGNIWITDYGANRVQEFDSNGNWKRTIPSSGCVSICPNTCPFSTSNGQFNRPYGIAIDASNHVWVTDSGNHRVQEFDANGNWLRGIGAGYNGVSGSIGSYGSGNGQLRYPYGITIDASGHIWVDDSENARMQEFDTNGNYLNKFGSGGSGNGQFNNPEDVTIASSGGNGSCAESANQGGGTLSNGGTTFEFTTSSVTSPATCTPNTMTCTSGTLSCSTGNMSDCQYSTCAQVPPGCSTSGLASFSPPSMTSGQSLPAYTSNSDASCASHTLTCTSGTLSCSTGNMSDCQYSSCYQTCPLSANQGGGTLCGTAGCSTPSQTKTEYTSSLDPTCTSHTMTCTGTSSSNTLSCSTGSMTDCQYGSCTLSGGGGINIWVLDMGSDRVQKFTTSGAYVSQFGSNGSGNGQFSNPYGIAIDTSGNIWVTDMSNRRMEEFNNNGTFLSTFGSFGGGNGQFTAPEGIAIDHSGNIWVIDGSRVQEFNSSGAYVNQFGSQGFANGSLDSPWGIAIDSGNNIWIVDTSNERVQKFNSSGTWLLTIPAGCANTSYPACAWGSGNGQFTNPRGIAVDSSNNIWVVDYGNDRVEEFSSTGTYIGKFGSIGTSTGQFLNPEGIAIDSSNNIWVTDSSNTRVQEFNSSGTYVSKFGSTGTGNGQFISPIAIAIH